jgi:hypothetical protein
MKKYILIGIILVLFVPIIPYEKEVQHGVTVVENKAVAQWLVERYVEIQSQKEKVVDVKNQPN